jgi:hypothetical protein
MRVVLGKKYKAAERAIVGHIVEEVAALDKNETGDLYSLYLGNSTRANKVQGKHSLRRDMMHRIPKP